MPIKFLFILVFSIAFISEGFSQENSDDTTLLTNDLLLLLQDKSVGGNIKLYQDPSLLVLMDKNTRINEKEGLDGFRIQLFSGSDQNARDKANEISQDFMKNFPDFNTRLIYTEYQAPYFKLRVGDYRNKNEAYEFFHQVKKKYPNSYIVKSKIKFPKLESVSK